MNPSRNELKQLPKEDRPRERLLLNGAEALSSIELLAILLGCGVKSMPVLTLAQKLLMYFGSLSKFAEATVAELCQLKGIGETKAIQLKAALALGARVSCQPITPKCLMQSPVQAYALVKNILIKEMRELFIVILKDIKSQLICYEVVAIGTLTKSLVHPREVFYPAIRHKAASIILAHNHPSGDLAVSFEDKRVTETLIQVGQLMGIPVEDHLIVSATGYFSLREHKICF